MTFHFLRRATCISAARLLFYVLPRSFGSGYAQPAYYSLPSTGLGHYLPLRFVGFDYRDAFTMRFYIHRYVGSATAFGSSRTLPHLVVHRRLRCLPDAAFPVRLPLRWFTRFTRTALLPGAAPLPPPHTCMPLCGYTYPFCSPPATVYYIPPPPLRLHRPLHRLPAHLPLPSTTYAVYGSDHTCLPGVHTCVRTPFCSFDSRLLFFYFSPRHHACRHSAAVDFFLVPSFLFLHYFLPFGRMDSWTVYTTPFVYIYRLTRSVLIHRSGPSGYSGYYITCRLRRRFDSGLTFVLFAASFQTFIHRSGGISTYHHHLLPGATYRFFWVLEGDGPAFTHTTFVLPRQLLPPFPPPACVRSAIYVPGCWFRVTKAAAGNGEENYHRLPTFTTTIPPHSSGWIHTPHTCLRSSGSVLPTAWDSYLLPFPSWRGGTGSTLYCLAFPISPPFYTHHWTHLVWLPLCLVHVPSSPFDSATTTFGQFTFEPAPRG